MDADTVAVPEKTEEVQQEVQENLQEAQTDKTEAVENAEVKEEPVKEQTVPLSALQKERRKRQDAEAETRIYKELQQPQEPKVQEEEDESQYEPVTKGDLKKHKEQVIRDLEVKARDKNEKDWIRQNPERAELINEKLTNFLKQRPNLATAIEAAPNRYEEAWELMDKLSPKQKTVLNKEAAKKVTPNSPSGVPKAAAMNQVVDVMNMSDSEFAAWRKSKRSRR